MFNYIFLYQFTKNFGLQMAAVCLVSMHVITRPVKKIELGFVPHCKRENSKLIILSMIYKIKRHSFNYERLHHVGTKQWLHIEICSLNTASIEISSSLLNSNFM